jgi:hypothetical protein
MSQNYFLVFRSRKRLLVLKDTPVSKNRIRLKFVMLKSTRTVTETHFLHVRRARVERHD